MKRMILSVLFVAAFGIVASAQSGKNTHGKVVSSTAHKSTTTVSTSTNTTQSGNGTATSTTKKHTGWTKGKHKGWSKKSKTSVNVKM